MSYCPQISAQESRRKKKEYMDQLERKVEKSSLRECRISSTCPITRRIEHQFDPSIGQTEDSAQSATGKKILNEHK